MIDHGKSRVTKFHLTDEQAMRDRPECCAKSLLETLQVHQVPDGGGVWTRSSVGQVNNLDFLFVHRHRTAPHGSPDVLARKSGHG